MGARSYDRAGVRGQGDALSSVLQHLGPTLRFPDGIESLTGFGHYASVMKVSDDVAIAFSTDGVGSKTIVASALSRYDTIGYDCVAMNVNDVICVGARPLAMVDYLAVNTLEAGRVDDILRGLGGAAKEAGIAIPGGELAQLPEVIGSDGRGQGDEAAFDLVGTCIGIVHPDRVILGRSVGPGDSIIGIGSSGIHSNGLTLARRVLLDQERLPLDEVVPELGRTLGEELLEPTEIYVRALLALWEDQIPTHGLAHITSDGFANLCRLDAEVGYRIEDLPPAPPIFRLIQERGDVQSAEMYRVFNMGVGFVVIVPRGGEEDALGRVAEAGYRPSRLGTVTDEAGIVRVEPAGLTGGLDAGESVFESI